MNQVVEKTKQIGPVRRWFAFLGGGLAWTFHLLTIYAVGEFGCVSGFDRRMYGGISMVAWLLLLFSVISLIPAIAASVIGFMDSRRDSRAPDDREIGEGGRYLSKYGGIVNALFALIIAVESLPIFAYLDGCGGGH